MTRGRWCFAEAAAPKPQRAGLAGNRLPLDAHSRGDLLQAGIAENGDIHDAPRNPSGAAIEPSRQRGFRQLQVQGVGPSLRT
jgi:hypothetical protein